MNGILTPRLTALLPNGTSFSVAHLSQDRVVLTGLTPGVNPFSPYRIGDLMPLTLLAERDGRREQMPVEARLDDLFAGEAHLGLPNGLGQTAPTMPAAMPAMPVVPVMPVAPAMPVGAMPAGAMPVGAMAATPYAPGAPAVALVPTSPYAPPSSYIDKTDREEIMRQEIAPVQTATYYTPTTGLATTSSQPPAVIPLPEDDRPSGSVVGRLAGFVLGGLFLLALLGLLLWQRSGIQSVQASLRGQSTQVVAMSEGVLRTVPAVGERVQPGQAIQISGTDGGTPEQMRVNVEAQQALVDQTTEMLEQARAIANNPRNFTRTYGGDGGGTSTRTVVVAGGGTTRSGGSGGTTVVSSNPAEIEAAQARVEASQVRLAEAQSELGRAQRLVEGGAMTRGELEGLRANAAAREADLRARQAELRAEQTPRVRSYGSGGGSTSRAPETRTVTTSRDGGSAARSVFDAAGQMNAKMRVLDLERDLARMQADLRTAQVRFDASQGTRSGTAAAGIPEGSVVTNILRPAGSYVRPGDPLFTVEGGGAPTVVAYFPFREARLIKAGAVAAVSMPSIGQTVNGRVTSLGSEAVSPNERYRVANENQLVPVSLTLDRVPAGAVPGTQADVTITVGLGTIFRGRLYH